MDLANVFLVMGVLAPMLLAAGFLLARYLHRRQALADELSPVTRQHIHLFQGGQLNEVELESAKTRLRGLLERGEVEAIEAGLRPGMHYVVQVRALAEIGTDEAGSILERQLHRRLTSDEIEQSWYWIDLASSLRTLNREESLPHLLRCAEAAGDIPLGHFYAAETVCFLGFAGYLRQADSPLRRTALRILHQSLEGLRFGVQPNMVAEARLGEMIETLWDYRLDVVDPLVVRVFAEALRQVRRAPHADATLADEPSEQEAFQWQLSRLTSLEPVLGEYLKEAPAYLCAALADASEPEQAEVLRALIDLRADAAGVALPLLNDPEFVHLELAIELLAWSRDPRVGPALREWALRHVPLLRRTQRRRRAAPPERPSVAAHLAYQAVLRATRGHPSGESEAFLLLACRDWDPTYRAAAVSSLGWWEPLHRKNLVTTLQDCRRDPNSEVRRAARAAQARLGERQALQWFRQVLACEDVHRVHEAIHAIGTEGLTLLWPDLDRLADSEDPEIAYHARESLERLSEELDHTSR